MSAAIKTSVDVTSKLVNGILAIKPLADFAKHQARQMMIKRAEKIGVPWTQEVNNFQKRSWDADFSQIENPLIKYPDYYVTSFHAYEEGNLSWRAAFELESAARAVHAKIWQDAGAGGDAKLRQSYHDILQQKIEAPQDIVDFGCGVGLSTFPIQEMYPEAQVTGVDLSAYFLAVANYRSQQHQMNINWVHAAAENTKLPDNSFDLVSIFLVCHELPQTPSKEIFAEAKRLLRKGGHIAIMDMNPCSEAFKKMPPYVFTLLKSTEPYLDDYFNLDIEKAIVNAGFQVPYITQNSPRHRTVIAKLDS
ncbi:MAG: class I SAM-dependent methyltransferase [Cyanobacteria bacterium P01_A01_bin.84]